MKTLFVSISMKQEYLNEVTDHIESKKGNSEVMSIMYIDSMKCIYILLTSRISLNRPYFVYKNL